MIFIVLIQESKGGGLSSNFSSANSLAGVRKTTDLVEKITWGLAIAMVVLSVLCAYVAPSATAQQSTMEQTTENPLTSPKNQQPFGASQEQNAPAAETPAAQTSAPATETPAP